MLKYIYLAILFIAAVSAFTRIRKGLPFHLSVFALLLLYTFLVEWSAFFKSEFMEERDNLQLYNCFMLVSFMAYAFYFKQIIKSTFIRNAILVFLYLYPIFWYFVVFFIFKIGEWNSYVYVIGGLFTVFWAIMYCYQLFTSEEIVRFRYCSEFWIAIGLIIFYSCGLPYMGMFNFLTKNHLQIAIYLRQVILISNIVMYSLFSYAFLCQMINTRKS